MAKRVDDFLRMADSGIAEQGRCVKVTIVDADIAYVRPCDEHAPFTVLRTQDTEKRLTEGEDDA